MEATKISVIIPTWNSQKTLGPAISSCLHQTLPPVEILVCDDGSTDNSKEIVDQINDSRVVWVPSLHSGAPAVPRNNGLKICKGEWIAFCDSDDEWLPTKLEKQIKILEKTKLMASCTNALIKKNEVITSNKVSNWTKKVVSFSNLLRSNDVICSSAIIHSSIYEKIGGFPGESKYKSFEDYIYWLRVSTKTDFAFVDESLVIYDDHPETSIRASETSAERIKTLTLDNFIMWSKEMNLTYFRCLTKVHIIKNKLLRLIKKIIHV